MTNVIYLLYTQRSKRHPLRQTAGLQPLPRKPLASSASKFWSWPRNAISFNYGTQCLSIGDYTLVKELLTVKGNTNQMIVCGKVTERKLQIGLTVMYFSDRLSCYNFLTVYGLEVTGPQATAKRPKLCAHQL